MSETTTNEYRKIARELVEIGQGVFSIHETLNPNNGYSVEVSKMACITLVKDIADLRKRCEEIAEQREGKVVIGVDPGSPDGDRTVKLEINPKIREIVGLTEVPGHIPPLKPGENYKP